jgi:predicted phage tail protein
MIINLHGRLGQKYGKVHKFKVKNTKDALDALCGNYKGFRNDIKKLAFKGLFYKAILNENKVCQNLPDYHEKSDTVDLVPCILGSSIGPAIVTKITGTAAADFGAKEAFFAGVIDTVVSIVLYGVVAILFAEDPESQRTEQRLETEGFLFTNTDNNAVQGFLVPIIYGQSRCGSSIISTNNNSFDVAVEKTQPSPKDPTTEIILKLFGD